MFTSTTVCAVCVCVCVCVCRCEMFTSWNKHEFSRDGVNWVTPTYNSNAKHLGGSDNNKIPDIAKSNGDKRE